MSHAYLVEVKSRRRLVEYYWTCTPSLILHILDHYHDVDVITYLDADLYFYADPGPIYQELGSASILIVEHRYAPEYAHFIQTYGIYNVGWLSFRRNANGYECLKWWRCRCLEWCCETPENDKYGDQRYLDDWPARFRGVIVSRNKGVGLGPWNISFVVRRKILGDLAVDEQPLIYFHFSGLRCLHDLVVDPAEGYVMPWKGVSELILPYANELRALSKTLQLPFPDERRLRGLELPVRILRQQLLLLRPRFLSYFLWHVSNRLSRPRVDTDSIDDPPTA